MQISEISDALVDDVDLEAYQIADAVNLTVRSVLGRQNRDLGAGTDQEITLAGVKQMVTIWPLYEINYDTLTIQIVRDENDNLRVAVSAETVD